MEFIEMTIQKLLLVFAAGVITWFTYQIMTWIGWNITSIVVISFLTVGVYYILQEWFFKKYLLWA